MQNSACSCLWPKFGSYAFVFSGVDGLSIDITTMVDIRDQTNKELAMRLVTDIQSGDVFYTDLNGFQVIKHIKRFVSDYVDVNAISLLFHVDFAPCVRHILCLISSCRCSLGATT